MRFAKYGMIPAAVALVALVCMSGWVAADESVARFPSFIPFVPPLNPLIGDQAEGVAVDKIGNVYVSVMQSGRGKIWKFTPTGEQSLFADVVGNGTSAGGLAVDAPGNVYLAASMGPDKGVYRIGRNGNPVLLEGTDRILSANALCFDQRGNLYVTESVSMDSPPTWGQGGIWRIPPKGKAELWLRHDLLTGTGLMGLGSPIGANGIAFYHGDLYVINTEKCWVVRIPVRPDGSPGQPEVWVALQNVLESPYMQIVPPAGDGLALDVHGNVYVAMVAQQAIVRINADDKLQETIAALLPDPTNPLFAPLGFPASLAFGTGKGGRMSLFVAQLGWLGMYGFSGPGPGLVKIDVDIPGLPLH